MTRGDEEDNCCSTVCLFLVGSLVLGVAFYLFFAGTSIDGQTEQDDLFRGQWVLNPSGPLYTNTSCIFIDVNYNCQNNGRPDTGYLHWRWKPYNSDLLQFNPKKFLNAMKGKSWAFIGDSLVRNQMMSLMCLLSEVETPLLVYIDETFRSRTVYFPSHNFTLATIWAPYLVKSTTYKNGYDKSEVNIHVYLDILEKQWTANYHSYDYVLIASGQWYHGKSYIISENDEIVGCNQCSDKNLKELGELYPYRRALQSAFSFITASNHKPLVFFRSWGPDHFENGEWNSGGFCSRTKPYREDQYDGKPYDQPFRDIEVEEFQKAEAVGLAKGIRMEFLDTYHLSMMRPDGHPGPYMAFHPFDKDKSAKVEKDCLHWCLPGIIDTWNELMLQIMMNSGAINSSASQQKAVI